MLSNIKSMSCLSVLLTLMSAANPAVFGDDATTIQSWPHGVVSADHPAASAAGAEILRRGGNVVDAAVATSFALSVVRPASCGIGGGGFMLIHDAEHQCTVALDYRERAPAKASRGMFSDSSTGTSVEPRSVRGGLAVAVPGTVAGLCYAAEHYGTLPLRDLLAPAIRLAQEGVAVDDFDRQAQKTALQRLRLYSDGRQKFQPLWTQYLNNGQPWKKGDRFFSPQKKVLQLISERGARAFYQGPVAEAIVSAVQQSGGILTLEDLRDVRPVVRRPLSTRFHGLQFDSMPPASSGGVALIQTLQTLQNWEALHSCQLADLRQNSADYVHVVSEAMKHAFADRAAFLGDTDFADVPVQRLLSGEYAKQIAQKIDLRHTLPPDEYGRFFAPNDGGTSHFSVMDARGNAVACTETINLIFGSFVVVPEFGIVLNNQMDDFAAQPGKPNAFGLIQSEANAVAPGKKPLSSMTPTLVIRDGKAIYAAGASGGPRIISATLQVTLNHVLFGLKPQDAVAAPRFHHQWFPDELLLEPALYSATAKLLQARGHKTVRRPGLAASQSAALIDGRLFGGSDPRKHGKPAGY